MNAKIDQQLDKQLLDMVQRSFPLPQAALAQDLWPAMLERLHQSRVGLSPLEWAFSILVLVTMLFFPQAALALLYHL